MPPYDLAPFLNLCYQDHALLSSDMQGGKPFRMPNICLPPSLLSVTRLSPLRTTFQETLKTFILGGRVKEHFITYMTLGITPKS